MKKEYLLLTLSTLLSLLVAIYVLSSFFPQLFGNPIDMQIVQLDTKLPSFYEGVFRRDDLLASEAILKDPITNVRGKPLYPEQKSLGPHDLLGFRNRSVPRYADIVTIGDSQTYGINALQQENWPSFIAAGIRPLALYNMSLGGYSAPQYLHLFEKAMAFRPQAIVIAFYSGNDPLESFLTSYNIDYWRSLRPDNGLKNTDAPKIEFPPPKKDWWHVTFEDDTETIFTPKHRFLSHDPSYQSTQAGYKIIFQVLRQIAHRAQDAGVPTIVTMIPSKELAFLPKLLNEKKEPTAAYTELIQREKSFIETFQKNCIEQSGIEYIDLVQPLQQAVLQQKWIYPPDKDGHPLPAGYGVIAKQLFRPVAKHIKKLGDGSYKVTVNAEKTHYYQLKNNQRIFFSSAQAMTQAGFSPQKALETPLRHLDPYPLVRSFTGQS